jgi:hypothetical protein
MSETTELALQNGAVSISVTRGNVIGQQKWSETEVRTSGGGGYVGPQGGHVAAPKIESRQTTKQEFWIRDDEGIEKQYQFPDGSFPVREGQSVWIALGWRQNVEGSGSYLFAYNANSDKYSDLLSDWKEWLYESRLLKKPFVYRLITSWLPLLAGLITGFVIGPIALASRGDIALPAALAQAATGEEIPDPLTLYQIWQTALANSSGSDIATMVIMGLLVWVPGLIVLRMIGKLFFLYRWEKKHVNAAHRAVFDECFRLGGSQN